MSDGDLMEGISGEAASLAGHLKLSNLCWIYDDNHITIEGHTSLAFSEDVAERFAGYGWNVVRVGDVNDLAALRRRDCRLPADGRPAHAGDRPQRDRLGGAAQAGHGTAPTAPAGRRGNPPGEGGLRLAAGRAFPRARGGATPFPRGDRRAGQQLRGDWEAKFAAVSRSSIRTRPGSWT